MALEGTLSVREARVIGSLPLERGARVRIPNGSIELVHVQREDDFRLTIRRRSVGVETRSFPVGFSFDAPVYALGNTTRGDVARLQPTSASSGLGWGVLPTGGVRQGTIQLQPSPIRPSSIPLDDAWLRDARLVILDWTSVDGYRVHATLDDASLERINSPAPRTSALRPRSFSRENGRTRH